MLGGGNEVAIRKQKSQFKRTNRLNRKKRKYDTTFIGDINIL